MRRTTAALALCGLLCAGVALADTLPADQAAIAGLQKCVQNNAANLAAFSGWDATPGGTPPGVPLTGSSDPCGTVPWTGLICSGNRIVQIITSQFGGGASQGLKGCDVNTLGALSGLSMLNQLDLSGSGVVGKLPDAWSNGFPALTRLTVAMNSITGTLPTSWAMGFPVLNELDVSMNSITGPAPASWGNTPAFPQIQNFVLSHNSLSGSLPAWNGLKGVQLLGLYSNNFVGVLPSSWTFPAITRLELETNQLTGCLPSTWPAQMPNLTHLDVSQNSLQGTIPANYASLNQLIDFTITPGNNFCGSISPALATQPNGMSSRFQPAPTSGSFTNGYSLPACPAGQTCPAAAPAGAPAGSLMAPTQAPMAAVSTAGRKLLSA